MKRFILLFLLCLVYTAQAQEHKYATVLSAPEGWRPEIIPFPLSFAPSLKYTGFEDIRFAPGWADVNAKDYFTYTFIWYLDEDPKLDAETLKTALEVYFDGLMAAVSERDDLPKTNVDLLYGHMNGAGAGKAEIKIFDAFFKKKVITLNVAIVHETCKNSGKYFFRFYLSPQAYNNEIWRMTEKVKLKVACENN